MLKRRHNNVFLVIFILRKAYSPLFKIEQFKKNTKIWNTCVIYKKFSIYKKEYILASWICHKCGHQRRIYDITQCGAKNPLYPIFSKLLPPIFPVFIQYFLDFRHQDDNRECSNTLSSALDTPLVVIINDVHCCDLEWSCISQCTFFF